MPSMLYIEVVIYTCIMNVLSFYCIKNEINGKYAEYCFGVNIAKQVFIIHFNLTYSILPVSSNNATIVEKIICIKPSKRRGKCLLIIMYSF